MTSITSISQHLQRGLTNPEYKSTQQDLPDEKEEKLTNARLKLYPRRVVSTYVCNNWCYYQCVSRRRVHRFWPRHPVTTQATIIKEYYRCVLISSSRRPRRSVQRICSSTTADTCMWWGLYKGCEFNAFSHSEYVITLSIPGGELTMIGELYHCGLSSTGWRTDISRSDVWFHPTNF